MGTIVDEIPGDDAKLHPALVGCISRWGRVGRRESTATLVRLIGLDVVASRSIPSSKRRLWGPPRGTTIELRLVDAGAVTAHAHAGGPVVRQGHIEGLTRIDRALLSLLFDRVAHSRVVTLEAVAEFSRSNRWAYFSALREWRRLVVHVAQEKGLLEGFMYTGRAGDMRLLRREVRHRISGSAGSLDLHSGPATTRLLELAIVFGLRGHLVRSLGLPQGSWEDVSASAGIDTIWQLGGGGFRGQGFG